MSINLYWAEYSVSDLIKKKILYINDGYRAKNSELSTSGLPFARAGNVHNGFVFDGADRFPETSLHKVGEKISLEGDSVFTSKGTVGRFALVQANTPRFVYSPQLCFWRVLDKEIIDSRFLFYWMQSREFRSHCDAVKGQTDMADYVSLRDQRLMKIPLPKIAEQKSISRILGALDDKIELNRQMNRTLEAMAQAIFKSWFVDFDPVVAKAAGRQPFGMDSKTAALFPSEFKDSELGPLPERWTVSDLVSDFRLTMGQSPPGNTYNQNGVGSPFFDFPKIFSDQC
jgi:type I restriction enzyme S subunit